LKKKPRLVQPGANLVTQLNQNQILVESGMTKELVVVAQ